MSQQLLEPERTVIVPPPKPCPAARDRRLVVQSFGLTDRGRVRPSNEDQFLIAELVKALRVRQSSVPQSPTQYSDERGYLLLVADGVGGNNAGEQASALAVGTIETFALNTFKWFFHRPGFEERNVLADFQTALGQADRRMFEEVARHPEFRGMGTTVTLAYCLDGELFVAHVGDSRCYLLRGGELHVLTHDHTLAAELARHGCIRPEQVAQHPYRHVITNVVGGQEKGLKPEVHQFDLEPDDVLLLCSDGLTEMLPPERIRDILLEEAEPKAACERLVAEANEEGGKDNVTVIVARFEAPAPGPQGAGRHAPRCQSLAEDRCPPLRGEP
jgi:protein phosphatase